LGGNRESDERKYKLFHGDMSSRANCSTQSTF
jgi:hypothetical protein